MDETVVLRFRDGRTERGTIEPVDPSRGVIVLHRGDGAVEEFSFSELKAVFFPHTGDESPDDETAGMKISVEFNDGEVIRGTAQYNPERNGFFLYPADRSKNDRIFVVNSAIVSIEVE